MAACAALGLAGTAVADGLSPPPFEVMNRHGVNMASGNASPSQMDVSIGDQKLGLTHTISTFSSNFVNWDGSGPLGAKDKYYVGAMRVLHHKPTGVGDWVYTMRVWDWSDNADFLINADGTFTSYNGDPRTTLVFTPNAGLFWTKPDGTVAAYAVGFPSISLYTGTGGTNAPIPPFYTVFPNGLKLSYWGSDPIGGVTTNTGYQLKYVYVANYAGVDNDDPTRTALPPAYAPGWSLSTPTYVVGINNAVDYCNPVGVQYASVDAACPGLTKPWPRATYSWPNGMPRAMYLRDNSFFVTDSMGRVTEYMHHPYSKPDQLEDPNFRVPRLIGIKRSNSSVPDVQYDYATRLIQQLEYGMWPQYFAGPIAQLSRSWVGTDSQGYTIAYPYQYDGQLINASGGYKSVARVMSTNGYGIWEIDSWDKSVKFEQLQTNKLQSVTTYPGGVTVTFDYDARRNITAVYENGTQTQTALYPTTCANPKTCNQATWTKDAKGGETDYEYDPNSGGISRVRLPADNAGIRPERRYTYLPKYAYFKNSAGAFQAADSPVYLLTKERTCAATATLADGSGCAGGAADEITTDYDYGLPQGPNNLQLRGVAVTAYVNSVPQVHRSCYSYDVYGNKIGETTPNAGLASCY